ncbi:MAG: trypsin-like serine protease [Planctomycetota bacterium]
MAASPAVGGVVLDGVDDAAYFALAAQPEYASVGKLTWSEPGGSFLGSGTLIAEDWVLTAAHNIDGADGAGSGLNNLKFSVGGATYAAEQWIAEPTWAALGGDQDLDNYLAGYDIALVKLSSPVEGVAPATLYAGEDELGLVGTAVGFGSQGVGSTGFQAGTAGTKIAGQNVIDAVGPDKSPGSNPFAFNVDNDRLLAVDFDSPTSPFESRLGDRSPLELEYLIAPGDSGGGLFIDVDGETLLAGVTSFGLSVDANGPNSDYGDLGGFTRVSSFVDWIEATLLEVDGPEELEMHAAVAAGAVPLTGDANGDGVVDAADLVVFRDLGGDPSEAFENFGSGSLSDSLVVAVVPEPSAGLLIAVGGLSAGLGRRGGRGPVCGG